MIELEVYAVGARNMDKVLELGHELETIPGLRYKVDKNHDIVYLEADEAAFSAKDVRGAFERIGLQPRFVGTLPMELMQSDKKKTQLL